MEGLHLLLDLLQPHDWIEKMDPKDAYLQIPIHPDYQHLPHLQMGGENLQSSMLTLWPLSCTQSVPKIAEASGGFSEADQLSPDNIPGPHTDDAPGENPSRTICPTDLSIIRESGANRESEEVHTDSNPRVRVLGHSIMLSIYEAVSTH